MKRETLPPWVLQVTGLGTFLFFCGFWAATNRVEPTLLAASGTLYSVGLVQQARSVLKKSSDPPATDKE